MHDRGERSTKRREFLGDFKPRASTGGLSILENLSVLPTIQQRYRQDVANFEEFAALRQYSLRNAAEVDLAALVEFLDFLFLEGEDAALGQRVVAG